MAKVIQRFYGQPDDLSQPARWFEVGDEVEGRLAESAIAQGNAKGKGPAPENKALAGAEKNKSGAASRRGQASRKKTAKKRKVSKS